MIPTPLFIFDSALHMPFDSSRSHIVCFVVDPEGHLRVKFIVALPNTPFCERVGLLRRMLNGEL